MKFQGVLKQTVQNYFYAIHTHINLRHINTCPVEEKAEDRPPHI